jgi:hypothetical protein
LFKLTPKNIWNERQNKPSLIVKDIKNIYPDIDEYIIYEILLRRGVFKWLAVRRELIILKNEWKETIKSLNRKKTDKEKGYLKAMENCRKQVRLLCHSERWQYPNFDSGSKIFLNNYKG